MSQQSSVEEDHSLSRGGSAMSQQSSVEDPPCHAGALRCPTKVRSKRITLSIWKECDVGANRITDEDRVISMDKSNKI